MIIDSLAGIWDPGDTCELSCDVLPVIDQVASIFINLCQSIMAGATTVTVGTLKEIISVERNIKDKDEFFCTIFRVKIPARCSSVSESSAPRAAYILFVDLSLEFHRSATTRWSLRTQQWNNAKTGNGEIASRWLCAMARKLIAKEKNHDSYPDSTITIYGSFATSRLFYAFHDSLPSTAEQQYNGK